jgi:glyoxylase-like metal-dependent hydrolase (beta-lactamase superfamily II)
VVKWDLLNLGQISRNRYWGEPDGNANRPGICNGVILQDNGRRIIVDPPFRGEKMRDVLNARTGLSPADIDDVFITHSHDDHFVGIAEFPHARWLCSPLELEKIALKLRSGGIDPSGLQAAPQWLTECIQVVPLPGHTSGCSGLLFQTGLGSTIITGDAVMTRDFFLDRRGYYISEDQEASAKTIFWIADHVNVVIPGHDNYFIVPKRII